MTIRAYYKNANRSRARTKPGLLSTANLRLLKKTALKTPNHALRQALLRLADHQEQLKLFS